MNDKKIKTEIAQSSQTVHKKEITFYDGEKGSLSIYEPTALKDTHYGYMKMFFDLYERVESLQKEVGQLRSRLKSVNDVVVPFSKDGEESGRT